MQRIKKYQFKKIESLITWKYVINSYMDNSSFQSKLKRTRNESQFYKNNQQCLINSQITTNIICIKISRLTDDKWRIQYNKCTVKFTNQNQFRCCSTDLFSSRLHGFYKSSGASEFRTCLFRLVIGVFATNSNFLNSISLPSDSVNL